MKDIYIVLTATGTLFSRCISFYTKEKYSHVSICIDTEINKFYSFGRKIIWFPLIGGFVVEYVDSGLFKLFVNTECAVFRLRVNNSKYNQLTKIINEFIANRKKYGYNIIGLFAHILKKPMKRKNKYFCTQFVASVLKNSGINLFDKDPLFVTPGDFYNAEGLELIYEGKLSELGNSETVKAVTV
jgi:hypothetical protein